MLYFNFKIYLIPLFIGTVKVMVSCNSMELLPVTAAQQDRFQWLLVNKMQCSFDGFKLHDESQSFKLIVHIKGEI